MMLDPQAVNRLAADLSARDGWPRPALLELQQSRLDALLRFAATASPYYRDAIGKAVADGVSLEHLPILTKRSLMDDWDRIVTDPALRLRDIEAHLADNRLDLYPGDYRPFATGGTTGERAVVVYSRDAWLEVIANVRRWVHTIGAGPGTKVVGIGAPTALHITNRAFAELQSDRADAPRLSVLTPVAELVEQLNGYQPEVVVTYPSFARRLVEEQDAGRLQIRPRCIASTAEVLANDVRARVRQTWNAPVLDSYGITEAGLLGMECDAAQGIHIAEDMVVFEVVDEHNRRVPDGTPGCKVLLTNLFNRTVPIIRYEISDIATITTARCACGRPYARVIAIEGRREDYMTLPAVAGGTVRIHAASLRRPLIGIPGLRQFQLVPAERRLTLRLTVRRDADAVAICAAAAAVAGQVLRDAGADVSLHAELVDVIERAGTAAKERLVLSSTRS